MAFTHTLAIDVLASIPQYRLEFAQTFGTDEIDIEKVTCAIAEFEKNLVTPNSRFDRWLLGRHFSNQENSEIVAFLKTLTGHQPSFSLPMLPPSADQTLRPTPFGK